MRAYGDAYARKYEKGQTKNTKGEYKQFRNRGRSGYSTPDEQFGQQVGRWVIHKKHTSQPSNKVIEPEDVAAAKKAVGRHYRKKNK